MRAAIPCEHCNGGGWLRRHGDGSGDDRCQDCRGTGDAWWTWEERSLKNMLDDLDAVSMRLLVEYRDEYSGSSAGARLEREISSLLQVIHALREQTKTARVA